MDAYFFTVNAGVLHIDNCFYCVYFLFFYLYFFVDSVCRFCYCLFNRDALANLPGWFFCFQSYKPQRAGVNVKGRDERLGVI